MVLKRGDFTALLFSPIPGLYHRPGFLYGPHNISLVPQESGRVVFEPYRKRLSKCDDTAARTVVIRRSGVTGHGKRMEEVGTGRSTQAS